MGSARLLAIVTGEDGESRKSIGRVGIVMIDRCLQHLNYNVKFT